MQLLAQNTFKMLVIVPRKMCHCHGNHRRKGALQKIPRDYILLKMKSHEIMAGYSQSLGRYKQKNRWGHNVPPGLNRVKKMIVQLTVTCEILTFFGAY